MKGITQIIKGGGAKYFIKELFFQRKVFKIVDFIILKIIDSLKE